MKKTLFSKIKAEKGAFDRVLVTLLLVIVGIVSVIGLKEWTSSQKDSIQNTSSTTISNVIKE